MVLCFRTAPHRLPEMRHAWVLACTGLLACSDGGGSSTDLPDDFVKGALTQCLVDSGDVTARCVNDYAAAIAACRLESDETCEPQARESGGALDQVIAATLRDNASTCDDEQAFTIGYFGGSADLAEKSIGACGRFGEELLSLAFAEQDDPMSEELRACQRTVSDAVMELHTGVVQASGPECAVLDFDREGCDRARRDEAIAAATERARRTIVEACGEAFDLLRLAAFGASVADRVQTLMDEVVDRGRNLAVFAYPPNNAGATAEFGPFPIGVRTFEAVDESRLNVLGDGPRPVTFDVYYPSTAEAVEGVPREIVSVLGIEILPAPAYRDVDVADGVYPLVLFSHGFEGIRFQSFFHVAHLASHGFIVVSPDHHGNTIPDTFAGIVDKATAVNRAFDMKFVMDQILDGETEPGSELAGSIDSGRIGMSGHSFGGYESFLLTGGEVQGSSLDETTVTLGTFTDARIKAILPMAPRTMRRVDAVTLEDDYFRTIMVPTLIIGSELDMTDPFFVDAKRAFDNLPIGAAFVGLAEVLRGGHNTFTDLCELQPDVLDLVGGADEGCTPRHLPWKHAHDLINYLALNFFDGVLNGDDEALERLTPEAVGELEGLRFWRK